MKSKIRHFQPANHSGRFFEKIVPYFLDLIRSKDFWLGSFFLVALLVLFASPMEPPIPKYNLGDIAHSTVRAPRDIQVPDVATTEKKKKEAQERVLPVYDFEPGLANSSASRVHEIFEFLRGQYPNGTKNKKIITEELKTTFKISLDPAFLEAASRDGFSEQLEKNLIGKLRKVMTEPIVTDRNVLYLYASRGLTVRQRERQREERREATSIPDIRDIQNSLSADLENEQGLDATTAQIYSNFLGTFIVPTIYYNSSETDARTLTSSYSVEPVFYQIKKGKVIIRDGEEITPVVLAQLKAIRDSAPTGPPIRFSIGVLILLLIFMIAFKKYTDVHQYSQIKLRNKALFRMIGLVLLLNVILVKLGFLVASSLSAVFPSSPFNLLLPYQLAIPFATGALLLTILTDREIPTIYSMAFAILVGVMTKGDFFIAFYCLASGIAAAFSLRRYYQRSALLRSALLIWGANTLGIFSIHLLRELPMDLNEMSFYIFCGALSAVLTAAVNSVMAPLLEWLFNITTDIKLLELSNLDLPVLRQLALEAPGTYHHSIVMGTIAEAAAEKVGANPLFLRVAALYHDIGKIRKSQYYVENQRDFNKHDTINPRMSALVIMNHVKEGLEAAKMLRLPSDLADLIPQHHGTRLITYFYKKAKDMENPDLEEVREEDYRYPGPKPQTKEAAILMLADATEAASRTLTDPTPARIQNMVDTLFRAIFEDGQLDESNLTMKDLNLIAEAFVRKMESVFHHRINYPGYEFNKDEKARDSSDFKKLSEKTVT